MLFLIFGSSAAGKTVALEGLRGRVERLAIHDFDEIGVPPDADTAWRQQANEHWVLRALEYRHDGLDMLLAGQTPLGEILAAPTAPRVAPISACLLDCDDGTRVARMAERGESWLERTGGKVDAYLNWAAWMRGHAADPSWQLEVIRIGETEAEMHWDRMRGWAAGDARWRVHVIDTSRRSPTLVVDDLVEWIANERTLADSGAHPLTDLL